MSRSIDLENLLAARSMLIDARRVANSQDLKLLSYLLDMASHEADDHIKILQRRSAVG